ncbi:hypothetical protein [Umezawaea sp.]|uniref:hypothetical protein n=1 Tax=Umezawaea sp. TaxID=1955258 RepID=UPI002ED4A942
MWLSSLLTSGATSLGRLIVVGLLPNAVPAVVVWLLLTAGSFSGPSHWERVRLANALPDAITVVLFLLVVVLVTVVLQPFQIRMVRVLEGYWDNWRLTARLAPVFVEFQRRRMAKLQRATGEPASAPEPTSALDAAWRRQREDARSAARRRRHWQRMERYPGFLPSGTQRQVQIPLLPTALGNVLREAETSAGERYGLDTVRSWPRLYPLFPERFAQINDSARDALDAAVTLCVNFSVTAVVTAVALHDEPKAYWIPVLAVALCFFSYLGAVAAAADYGLSVKVGYDLYRFDLLKASHYRLPENTADEFAAFAALSTFYAKNTTDIGARALAKRYLGGAVLPYQHDEAEDTAKDA